MKKVKAVVTIVKKMQTKKIVKKQSHGILQVSSGVHRKFEDKRIIYSPFALMSKTMFQTEIHELWIKTFYKPPFSEIQCNQSKQKYVTSSLDGR